MHSMFNNYNVMYLPIGRAGSSDDSGTVEPGVVEPGVVDSGVVEVGAAVVVALGSSGNATKIV